MRSRLRFLSLVLSILSLSVIIGCNDQLDLENSTTPLALGMDLDSKDRFRFYSTSPVFSESIKKKSQETNVLAESLRQSRAGQDSQSAGATQGRNYQVILVGRRMLEHEGWFKMMDVLYRDSKNTVADRMIAVDGPVSEVIYLSPPDQPLVPVLLRGMVDTKNDRSETVKTTAQEFHRQMFEKGLTPFIAEIKVVNKKIRVTGIALLNKQGKYVASLRPQETTLLAILQKNIKPGISLSFQIPDEPKTGPFSTDMVSFTPSKLKTTIKTDYKSDRFKFDIHIKGNIGLSERLFPYDVDNNAEDLQKKIAQQMKEQLEAIVHKIQQHKIDPIGLGLYARAYEYKAYKKVEDHWGEALADADINITVDLTIGAMGPVQ